MSRTNAAVDSRYLFTGREFDADIDLYFNRARYYDANTGHFIIEDPSGFGGRDFNLSRYVRNDPIDRRDPEGLQDNKQSQTPTTLGIPDRRKKDDSKGESKVKGKLDAVQTDKNGNTVLQCTFTITTDPPSTEERVLDTINKAIPGSVFKNEGGSVGYGIEW